MNIGTKIAMMWHHTGFTRWLARVELHMLDGFVSPEDVEAFRTDHYIREAFFHAYRGGADPIAAAYTLIVDMLDAQEQLKEGIIS